RNGFELFVQDDKLHFRKPKQEGSLRLEWLKDLTSFQVRVTSAEQVSEVEVRGWDLKQKRSIVANKNNASILTETEYGQGKKTSSAFQGKPGSPKLVVVDQPIATQQEADKIAQALFHELSDEFVQADAQAQGNPGIRPGRVVTLEKMGKYSGKYYVTETHHTYHDGVYLTAFSIRGLRGGDLLSLLSPATRLQPGQTLLIGIVTNNQDPDKLGRVRVKFPTLTEEHESDWARVVAIGAGKSRGFDCLPEIDDEVLVGFEHGDIHRPFVIGGLWNGKDAPPTPVDQSVDGSGVRLRTIKTRTGHHMQFVEADQGSSKKGILIKSVYGHQVYLNDSEKKIEIRTSGGHVIVLDDQGRSIQMKSSGGHQLNLNDVSRSVSLESVGSMTLKATTNLDIQATGMVTVKGLTIRLN
ncbi:MAG: phage baseplate assembly protein V, partial [Leptolyngbyaceae cyanobacterium bins.59]|nr:phage baseplate assembly protein V [Leptolyngbyaceae cyanobacterium bins.59]